MPTSLPSCLGTALVCAIATGSALPGEGAPLGAPHRALESDSRDEALFGPEFLRVLEAKARPASERAEPLKVSMGDFGYGQHRIPTPFAHLLEDELAAAFAGLKGIEVYARRDLHQVESELEKSFYPEIWQVSAEVGELIQTEAVLTGRYSIRGERVEVRLKLLDVRTSQELWHLQTGCSLTAELRPLVSPAKLPTLEKVMADITPSGEPDFRTALWVDRGQRAEYRFGETMEVHLRANLDCYVKLYYLQADGKIKRLYPNRFSSQRKLKAGAVVTLPGSGDYAFRFGEPAGVEVLFAETSSEPFSTMEPDFEDIGVTEDIGKVRTRGIEVVSKREANTKRSWARCLLSVRGR